jgi:hypothetical protein
MRKMVILVQATTISNNNLKTLTEKGVILADLHANEEYVYSNWSYTVYINIHNFGFGSCYNKKRLAVISSYLPYLLIYLNKSSMYLQASSTKWLGTPALTAVLLEWSIMCPF